jgi:hypothetical protein
MINLLAASTDSNRWKAANLRLQLFRVINSLVSRLSLFIHYAWWFFLAQPSCLMLISRRTSTLNEMLGFSLNEQ